MRKIKGVTLLEVMIACIIVAMVIGGLTNIFVSSQRWIMHARSRMQGGEIGKHFLDPISLGIKQGNWSAASTAATFVAHDCVTGSGAATQADGACDHVAWTDPNAHVDFTPHYAITAVHDTDPNYPLGRLRRVELRLNWTENRPSP